MIDWVTERKNRGDLASQQQQRAANPLKSVWVEASAGTGKTKVLSDRVLRLLLQGTAPGKILCLTYTKAAAVEMNMRISGRLSRWAVIDEEQLEQELQKLLGKHGSADTELKAMARKLFAMLLDTPGGMKIQTIHSFCQEILKRFPLEAHISPYFEVMDDRAAAEALEDIKKRLLQKIELEPESRQAQALQYIISKVSEFAFPKLMSAIAANRSKIAGLLSRYHNDVQTLAAATAERLRVSPQATKESVTADFFNCLPRREIEDLKEALSHGSDSDVKRAEVLAAVLSSDKPELLYEDYAAVFLKADGEPRAKQATKKALDFNPLAAELAECEAWRCQQLNNQRAAAGLFAATRAVLYLAEDLISGYNHFKKQHSKMDYEDLIVLTRQLLENRTVADWVLFKLDGGIDHVLIDEAQDTSPDQWAIVRALTEEFFSGKGGQDKARTVFAVGDRKQSIYSFQGADPQEFENMRRFFSGRVAGKEAFEEVKLDVSFRSTAAVLDTVNEVFRDETAARGVVSEGENMTHTPWRTGDGGKVELWPLIEPLEGENPNIYAPPVERITADSTSSRLAAQIAGRIKEMVEGKELLVSQGRALRYSDFMILVQRRNSFVEEMVRACKNAGVAVAGVDKIRLQEQIAVQDLIAVSRFLLLPEDDLTLATILKSPLWGLDDDDLLTLCYGRGTQTLWERLQAAEKYRQIAEELKMLLNKADLVRPFELYAFILNKLNGRKKMTARLGPDAEDGIDEFVNLTLDFEREHIPTLQNFIDWISRDEVEIKRELEQSDINAVRIMTVHGSKGLQAPVVILPDTVRVKAIKNESGMLWDDLMYYPLGAEDYEETCRKIKESEKELSLQEYRRLLYVALTRAEDRLCICGYRKSFKPSEESWYEICRRALEKIAKPDDDGLCYEIAQQTIASGNKKSLPEYPALPIWEWLQCPAREESVLARPLAPSKLDDEEEPALISPISGNGQSSYRRGLLIHKLLQILPELPQAAREQTAGDFLQKYAAEMSSAQQRQIVGEVMRLFENPQFTAIFGPDSRAEVPVMGQALGHIISGKIDRLAIDGNKVMIIDYKTNRPAARTTAEVPNSYRKQLRAYRELIAKIYPGHEIQTFILWTDIATLMRIDG